MYISGVRKEKQTPLSKPSDNPDDYVLARNMARAFQYAMKGCDLGNMYSCANVSQMYAKGEGVEKNDEKAEAYKKMALEMQDQVMNQRNTLTFQEGLPKS